MPASWVGLVLQGCRHGVCVCVGRVSPHPTLNAAAGCQIRVMFVQHSPSAAACTHHGACTKPTASQPASGGSSSGRLACSAARTAANSSRRCLCAHAAARAVSAQPGLGGSRMDSHTQLSAPSLRTVLGCAPAHGPRLSFFELCAQQEAPAHQTPAVPVLPACSPPLTLHNRLCAICW